MGLKMIVPELYCTDIQKTRSFYIDVLQMSIKYERSEDLFIYFEKAGASLMVEQLNGNSRKWITSDLDQPFGRGVNFEWQVECLAELYQNVLKKYPESIYLELEKKEYRCGEKVVIQSQFIVQDPDGYLFRFCSN
ncbi:VOC family protein [bacterium]|nr:VOC family protein [bacterium]